MNLDDLKNALTALDQRLDRQVAIDLRDSRERAATTALHRSLRPLALGQWLQAALGFVSILLGVAAWRSDLAQFGGVFVSGVIVHVYGVAMIALAIATRVLLARVDDAGPVLEIQRRLAELRRLTIAGGYVLGMSWWVLWVPFLIVVFRDAFGVNLYALNPLLAAVLIAGGVVGFLASALLHRWAAASGRIRLAGLLDNALTGMSLRNAQAQLSELARFEHD